MHPKGTRNKGKAKAMEATDIVQGGPSRQITRKHQQQQPISDSDDIQPAISPVIHLNPVLVQESQSEQGDVQDFAPHLQIPVLDEDSTLPEVVDFRRTLKGLPPVPPLVGLPKASMRVLFFLVLMIGMNDANHPFGIKLQSISPFDPNNIAYESTASHKYHFTDSDSDSQEGFALPALERDNDFNERGDGFGDNDQQDNDGFDNGDGGEQDNNDSNDNGQDEPGGSAIPGAQANLQQPRNQHEYPLQRKLSTLRRSWVLKLRHGIFNKFTDLISIPAPPRAQQQVMDNFSSPKPTTQEDQEDQENRVCTGPG
ncbi:hypothetical protein AAF712_014087 [Marasmius tenuissimus]|uniref:Uncharacterized protein n=1 Tax=Marasmius tenuissimus TaxID=585030 RepID=A0ABR2ZEI9_9AGAR